ncbi:MAG: hypothetical protein K8S16_11165 [Bacteroidales bacterium]|nr:hypothetical protein [Bacteroidales bacterium]
MNSQKKKLFLIKFAYWFGIGADSLWAIGLLFPQVFCILTGNPDFNPDLQTRLIMGIGGSLMTGWTFLLLWAVRKPVERRVVILLTAFPVVFGLFIVALVGFWEGSNSNIWILVKSILLMTSMITSYILAGKMEKKLNT